MAALVEAMRINGQSDHQQGKIVDSFGVITTIFGHDGHNVVENDDFELGSGYKKCMGCRKKELFREVQSSEQSIEPSTVEES